MLGMLACSVWLLACFILCLCCSPNIRVAIRSSYHCLMNWLRTAALSEIPNLRPHTCVKNQFFGICGFSQTHKNNDFWNLRLPEYFFATFVCVCEYFTNFRESQEFDHSIKNQSLGVLLTIHILSIYWNDWFIGLLVFWIFHFLKECDFHLESWFPALAHFALKTCRNQGSRGAFHDFHDLHWQSYNIVTFMVFRKRRWVALILLHLYFPRHHLFRKTTILELES